MMSERKKAILIVHSEKSVRDYLALCLSDEYECLKATSTEEARSLLIYLSFDLLMIDPLIDEESGIKLCKSVRVSYPGTVVLLMFPAQQNFFKGAKIGKALDWDEKPFDLSEASMFVKQAFHRPLPVQSVVLTSWHFSKEAT